MGVLSKITVSRWESQWIITLDLHHLQQMLIRCGIPRGGEVDPYQGGHLSRSSHTISLYDRLSLYDMCKALAQLSDDSYLQVIDRYPELRDEYILAVSVGIIHGGTSEHL